MTCVEARSGENRPPVSAFMREISILPHKEKRLAENRVSTFRSACSTRLGGRERNMQTSEEGVSDPNTCAVDEQDLRSVAGRVRNKRGRRHTG